MTFFGKMVYNRRKGNARSARVEAYPLAGRPRIFYGRWNRQWRKNMMFEKDDIVLYGTHGVCRVQGQTAKDFAGMKKDYYVLQPVFEEASVVYVPADSPKLTAKMHHVATKEEILRGLSAVPKEGEAWIEDEPRRREVFRATLEEGNRRKLIQMVQSLLLHQKKQQAKGRRLHISDEQFLRDAEKIIEDEIAYVLAIKREEVVPFIRQQLDAAAGE